MEELIIKDLLIEIIYVTLWIGLFMFIFHPKWAPEKSYQYKSRKFRMSIVFFGVITAFFSLGKVDSFNSYMHFVLILFSVALGVNVIQKYVEGTTNLSQIKKGDNNSDKQENTKNS